MSTNNRIGRNPFDKSPKAKKPAQASETTQVELVLKTSDKKTEALAQFDAQAVQPEAQIIGELIEIPEENWQPLTGVPTQFFKHLFLSWL